MRSGRGAFPPSRRGRFLSAPPLLRPPARWRQLLAGQRGWLCAALAAVALGAVVGLELRRAREGTPEYPFPVIPRSRWASQSADRSDARELTSIRRITIHHEGAAGFEAADMDRTARHIERIRRFHREDRGWADIAYHLVIDRAGRVWEGRSRRLQGAHAGNEELNAGNLGILLLGNLDRQPLARAQRASLSRVLRGLLHQLHLKRGDVFAHGELRPTDCPGEAGRAWLEGWRAAVSDSSAGTWEVPASVSRLGGPVGGSTAVDTR